MSEKRESFLEGLFKGKKLDEAKKTIEFLNSSIKEKEESITNLKKLLSEEEEKRKKAEIFSKQSDIIQKNLEARDRKIKELEVYNQDLLGLKNEFSEKVANLEKQLKDSNDNCSDIMKKYEILNESFDKTHEEHSILKEEHNSLKERLESLNSLKEDGAQMQIVGDTFVSKDTLNNIEEELDRYKERCESYNNEVKKLYSDLETSTKEIDDYRSRLHKALSIDLETVNYKLPSEVLFTSTKFKEILNTLEENTIKFLDEIDVERFEEITSNSKGFSEARKLFLDCKKGHYSWDVKTFLMKGPRLSKIFSRQRKLMGYFDDNYMEFLIDLKNFDQNLLASKGFSESHISKYNEVIDEYRNYRIQR